MRFIEEFMYKVQIGLRDTEEEDCNLGQKEQGEPGVIGTWKKSSACRRGLFYRLPGSGRVSSHCELSLHASTIQ